MAKTHLEFSSKWASKKQENREEEEQEEESKVTEEVGEAAMAEKPLVTKNHSTNVAKKNKAVLRLRSAFTVLLSSKKTPNVTGTLFGNRKGHVHLAFQEQPTSIPVFLVELATSTSNLVKEMASGLVRIALECEKGEKKGKKLLEEPVWRTYCNGRKSGYAMRRECGAEELRVLRAIQAISMGAGVLPGLVQHGSEGELMYMRARFERVVGSRDSEALYMMNPDGSGGPELSIFLLRV